MSSTTNSSTSSSASPVRTSFMVVHAAIIITGVIGNSLVVQVVRTAPSMYTTTNFLLVNVAIANLLTVICLVPADGLSFLEQPGGATSDFLCRFLTYNSLPKLTAAVSGTTFALIAVERYHAVLKPLRPGLRLTCENVRYAIAAIWVFWLVMLSPFVAFIQYDDSLGTCTERWNSASARKAFLLLLSAILVAILFTIIFCYSYLIKEVYFTKSVVPESALNGEDKKTKRKILQLVLLVTATYILCFAPYISAFVRYACFSTYDQGYYRAAVTLMYCNSSINPVVCAFQSSNYRQGFRRILCGWKNKRRTGGIGSSVGCARRRGSRTVPEPN